MTGRRLTRALLSALVVLTVAGAVASHAEDDPLLARAYEVLYRDLTDAADVVEPLLSEAGELTLRPRLNALVVVDRGTVLDRVTALLERYDLPPQDVEVTFSLILGTARRPDEPVRRAPSGNELSREVRGVMENIGNFTKWTSYEPLGTRSVTGAEGDRVVATLSDEYRVVFIVESVLQSQGQVNFRSFALQRLRQNDDGTEGFEDQYRTTMTLNIGRLHVVGAASGPDSNRALFLTLQAQPR